MAETSLTTSIGLTQSSNQRVCHCSPPASSGIQAIPLPRREHRDQSHKVWKLDSTPNKTSNTLDSASRGSSTEIPPSYCALLQRTDTIKERCDVQSQPGGKCCKEEMKIKRNLISHEVIRDIIIGWSDGMMVPFALTAGLSSLGNSKLVYLAGFGELISGSISMGLGGYLAAKAEQDAFRHKYNEIKDKHLAACQSEIDREVHEVIGPLGVHENVSRIVADNLRSADGSVVSDSRFEDRSNTMPIWRRHFRRFARRKTFIADTGTVAFLLKFGEGMEEVPPSRLVVSAFTIALSYFLGGLFPIIPYLAVKDALHGLYWSILTTGIILIGFGILKSWYTGAAHTVIDCLWGAISTLFVGAGAAAASYGVVYGLNRR